MNYIKHKSDESLEDYLETILLLQNRLERVRSIDIAKELNFTKASVSVAMKNLRNKGYADFDENGYITLTDTGLDRAQHVLERHTILSDWLISMGVSRDIALKDACRIEHDISEESFEAIKKCVNKIAQK